MAHRQKTGLVLNGQRPGHIVIDTDSGEISEIRVCFPSAACYALYKAAVMVIALKSEWIKIGRNKEPLFSYE